MKNKTFYFEFWGENFPPNWFFHIACSPVRARFTTLPAEQPDIRLVERIFLFVLRVSNIYPPLSCEIVNIFSLYNQIRMWGWKLRRGLFEGGKESSGVLPRADYRKIRGVKTSRRLAATVWLCYLGCTVEADSSWFLPCGCWSCSLEKKFFISETAFVQGFLPLYLLSYLLFGFLLFSL